MTDDRFPRLEDWDQTRDSLHAYSRVLGAVRRQLAAPHPRWWHISLLPAPYGLTTGSIPVHGGGAEEIELAIDLRRGGALLRAGASRREVDLVTAPTATALGEQVVAWLANERIDLPAGFQTGGDDARRTYDAAAANRYLRALVEVDRVFTAVRGELAGEVGPIQLWPHHFDLSFEWFGDRRVVHEEGGETQESPAQIGFGFSTGDAGHPDAYFYANPWPFDDAFREAPLPAEARWHAEGWQGGLLPYEAARRRGPELLADFLRAVHAAAAPSLSR